MRVILATILLFTLLAFAPGSSTPASADDCDLAPGVPLVQIEDASACGGATGMIGRWWSSDEGHYDCWFYSDWPYPQLWFVHGC